MENSGIKGEFQIMVITEGGIIIQSWQARPCQVCPSHDHSTIFKQSAGALTIGKLQGSRIYRPGCAEAYIGKSSKTSHRIFPQQTDESIGINVQISEQIETDVKKEADFRMSR